MLPQPPCWGLTQSEVPFRGVSRTRSYWGEVRGTRKLGHPAAGCRVSPPEQTLGHRWALVDASSQCPRDQSAKQGDCGAQK